MTLLEVIKEASAKNKSVGSQIDHPIILNPADVFSDLKPATENPSATSLVNPVSGWKISETDAVLIDLGKKFYGHLKRKLKDINNFCKSEFVRIFNHFLENICEKFRISAGVDRYDRRYTSILIERIGFLMGRDVANLVLEACVSLKIWELVESLIVNKLVDHWSYSDLVTRLVSENRSYLLCLCIKHTSDIGSFELLCILKYFLCPSKDAFNTMVRVRKEWESDALLAIEKASDPNLPVKLSRLAKEASILLMVAHDGFSVSELCLHYLLASLTIDEVVFSSSVSKLSGREIMCLIRYLGKWLKKFANIPQAHPCPEASSTLDLKSCNWVPKLEVVVKSLGLVLDENFSVLVMNHEFQEELRSIEEVISSLALESRFFCPVADVLKNLGVDGEGVKN